jgi:hypothetical protein
MTFPMAPQRRLSVKLRAALTTAAYEQRIGPRARDLMAELVSFREFLEQSSAPLSDRAAVLDSRAWMHVGAVVSEIEKLESLLRKR